MSSASSTAVSGNIYYGDADGTGTSQTLIWAVAIVAGLFALVMLMPKKK